MKKITIKYKKNIEISISIIGLMLTIITMTHNWTLINTIISFDAFQVNTENLKLHSIEVLFFFLPYSQREKIHHLYEKYVPTIAWGNLLIYVSMTITFNYFTHNPLLHHIGILTLMEFIVLLFEKRPVEKFHKIIDTVESLLI